MANVPIQQNFQNRGYIPNDKQHKNTWWEQFTLPRGVSGTISSAGWTTQAPGYTQHTFLGASVQSFDISAGFGDSSSTLSVRLVEDTNNNSDGKPLGDGIDAYHNGKFDIFRPPAVGSPVFFYFNQFPTTVEQAYKKTIDDLYGLSSAIEPVFTDRKTYSGTQVVNALDQYMYVDLKESDLTSQHPKDQTYTVEDRIGVFVPGKDDDLYSNRGYHSLVFGGILTNYTESESMSSRGIYNVTVTDPRNILKNCQVILNNWRGESLGIDNILNVYGFLEYNPPAEVRSFLEEKYIDKSELIREVSKDGVVTYKGNGENEKLLDLYELPFDGDGGEYREPNSSDQFAFSDADIFTSNIEVKEIDEVTKIPADVLTKDREGYLPRFFPITGQGMSRRTEAGVPFYRIRQALETMMEYYGELPGAYEVANPDGYSYTGFGNRVNFRGFEYVIDWSGLPLDKIPPNFYFDYDQLDFLSLAQEICEITSHELYVTLLPIVCHEHPSMQRLDRKNMNIVKNSNESTSGGTLGPESEETEDPDPNEPKYKGFVAGVIRLDAIDKSEQPRYGAIIEYVKDLIQNEEIAIKKKDAGFELSNVVTDKVILGAQEVDMYFFSSDRDRDDLFARTGSEGQQQVEEFIEEQWDITTSLKQQVLPFYGFIGDNKAVTIPKGFGAYQQILLDARDLNAFGVGNYYVATEMELRAALVSQKSWEEFLKKYNNTYIADTSEHQFTWAELGRINPEARNQINDALDVFKDKAGITEGQVFHDTLVDSMKERAFAVTVPRSVWSSDKPYMGKDGYPASPCNPPYGYPLYYKRAMKIGILDAGYTEVFSSAYSHYLQGDNFEDAVYGSGIENVSLVADDYAMKLAILQSRREQLSKNIGQGYSQDPQWQSYNTEYNKIRQLVDEYKEVEQRLLEQGDKLIAKTKGVVTDVRSGNNEFYNTAGLLKARNENNVTKVYNFVKKIAEENLGKKFLVKIPTVVNHNYSPSVKTYFSNNPKKKSIHYSPFGFMPRGLIEATEEQQEDDSYVDPLSDSRQAISSNNIGEDNLLGQNSKFTHYLANDIFVHSNGVIDTGKYNIDEGSYLSDNYVDKESPDNKYAYTQGALKSKYNPISEEWEFNYKIEPLGGWPQFPVFDKNIDFYKEWDRQNSEGSQNIKGSTKALPNATKDAIVPTILNKLQNDNGRISCFARFNNSDNYSFANVSSDSVVQQTQKYGGNWTPDIAELLPNLKNQISAGSTDYQGLQAEKKRKEGKENLKTVAFVKCEVDERFYMPPRLAKLETQIFASQYEIVLSELPVDIEESEDEDGCKVYKQVVNRFAPVFKVADDGGVREGGETVEITDFVRHIPARVTPERNNAVIGNPDGPQDKEDKEEDNEIYTANSEYYKLDEEERLKKEPLLIDAEGQFLDNNHVYALITVPGRITSYADFRHVDSVDQIYNTVNLKNLMTQDVVKINDFKFPAFPEPELGNPIICSTGSMPVTLKEVAHVKQQAKLAMGGQEDLNIHTYAPSPIYPDMVAIPLLSWERCYGPWFSANDIEAGEDGDGVEYKDRYYNIGGKVEVKKDENLAPWNYGGYALLDAAGALEAEFSNSLLLISEKGSIDYVGGPTGVAIGKHLKDRGPLVTNIRVSVNESSISTSVSMDLYTVGFSKINEERKHDLSRAARERQKIIDQNNNLIRRNLGKQQTSLDLRSDLLKKGAEDLMNLKTEQVNYFMKAENQKKEVFLETNLGTMSSDRYSMINRQNDSVADKVKQQGIVNPVTNESYRVVNQLGEPPAQRFGFTGYTI